MATQTFPSIAVDIGFAANPLDALSTITWTTVSDSTTATERRALDIQTSAGRNHELGTNEAGTATILLDNTDRRFDPEYTAGPYGSNVKPWRRVRIRAHRGAAVVLDGTNDYLISASSPFDPASQSFTAEQWLKPSALGAVTRTIMAQQDGAGTGKTWLYAQASTGLVSSDLGALGGAGIGTKALTVGVWSHVALVYDDTATTVTIYVDGVVSLSVTASAGSATGLLVSGANKLLANPFAGTFDDIRIWNVARTAAQIRANYRKQVSATATGLLHSWLLDEGTGTTAASEATANTLTLTNGPTWATGISTRPYYLFTGFATSWSPSYLGPGESVTRLEAVDPLALLSRLVPTVTPYSRTVLDDSPYLYWRLGETLGTVAADLSGNARTGTYSAAAVLGAEPMLVHDDNRSTQLIPNGYVDGGAVASFERTQAFTIECWFNAGDAQQSAKVLVGKYDPATSNRGIRVFLDGYGFIVLTITNGAGNSLALTAGTPVTDTQKHHLVVTYDGSSTAAGTKLYKDGVELSRETTEDTLSATIINAGTFRVGGTISSQAQDVAVYTTALSAARVLAHYQAGVAPLDGQWSGERITSLLSIAGWLSADQFIDRGVVTLAPQKQLGGVLATAREVASSELGAVYASPGGRIRFSARYANIANSVSWKTWGDSGTELDYLDFTRVDDDADLWTEIHATAQDGLMQVAVDTSSITTYGPGHTKEISGLWRDDNQAKAVGDKLLDRYASPKMRISSLKLRPLADADYIAVLGTDLHEERITFIKRPVGGGTITKELWVEAISHHITDITWDTTFGLVPADTAVTNFLTLDSTALNSGVVLAA